MSGFPVLDVVIGLSFLYLLFALSCTALNEVIAGIFDRRAKMLRDGIEHLLGDEKLADAVYQHPSIASLAKPSKKLRSKPSYIPKERFAAALTSIWVVPFSFSGQTPPPSPQSPNPEPCLIAGRNAPTECGLKCRAMLCRSVVWTDSKEVSGSHNHPGGVALA
jgi:hypothetical protein